MTWTLPDLRVLPCEFSSPPIWYMVAENQLVQPCTHALYYYHTPSPFSVASSSHFLFIDFIIYFAFRFLLWHPHNFTPSLRSLHRFKDTHSYLLRIVPAISNAWARWCCRQCCWSVVAVVKWHHQLMLVCCPHRLQLSNMRQLLPYHAQQKPPPTAVKHASSLAALQELQHDIC